MANFPGPYELRFNYSTIAAGITLISQHRFSLDFAQIGEPGDPFSEWLPQGRLTAFTQSLDDFVNEYVTFLLPFFPTNANIVDVELWEYEAGSFNAAFRSSYAIAVAGTNGSPSAVDGQMIVTFRSTLGGILKLDLRQTIYAPAIFQLFPTSSGAINDWAAFVVGNNTCIRARDNGFAFSPYKFLPGANEKYTKNRLR